MSNTSQLKKAKPPGSPAPQRAEVGPIAPGRDILVEALEREGVEVIFAYPGGASMEIHQALTRSKKIRTVLPRHEQGGNVRGRNVTGGVVVQQEGGGGRCRGVAGPG